MTTASGVYPLHVGMLADHVPAAAPRVNIEQTLDREIVSSMGVHRFVSPPPPGVSTSLVMFCTVGCLLAVVLVVRGEAFIMHLLR